jgi:tetratricopeptide (TPR) repeat protein
MVGPCVTRPMTFEDRVDFYRSRAAIALAQQHWAEAEQELQALVAISPNDAIAWNNLGVALEHQHKNREAVEAYARAAALSPGSQLPGGNLVREMQRYLGFAAALVLFRVVDIALRFVPMPADARTAATAIAFVLLAFGALVYYQRQREQLPDEAWRAYKSELARTRQLRYGGIAFVFVGFLVFAVVFAILVQFRGVAGDGTVVLVAVAGLCWLIVARLVWAHVVAPRLQGRIR